MKHKIIAFVGGGTGGHIFPGLSVLRELDMYLKKHQRTIPDLQLRTGKRASRGSEFQISVFDPKSKLKNPYFWIGERKSMEAGIMKKEGVDFFHTPASKLRRYFSFRTIFTPLLIFLGVIRCYSLLKKYEVHAVFSKGGYVSLPCCIAAYLSKIPVVLHESDSIPGLANRLCSRFASTIFLSFPSAKKYFPEEKIAEVGYLYDPMMIDVVREKYHEKNDEKLGFRVSKDEWNVRDDSEAYHHHPKKTHILVNCGSQGAKAIFAGLSQILEHFSDFELHIILGTKNLSFDSVFQGHKNIHVYPFITDKRVYYRLMLACDIVITRGGSSIFEHEAFGLKQIIIPLPNSGNNHQEHNAQVFADRGHYVFSQKNFSAMLVDALRDLSAYKKSENVPKISLEIYAKILRALLN